MIRHKILKLARITKIALKFSPTNIILSYLNRFQQQPHHTSWREKRLKWQARGKIENDDVKILKASGSSSSIMQSILQQIPLY
jgi:hypothetical protein